MLICLSCSVFSFDVYYNKSIHTKQLVLKKMCEFTTEVWAAIEHLNQGKEKLRMYIRELLDVMFDKYF